MYAMWIVDKMSVTNGEHGEQQEAKKGRSDWVSCNGCLRYGGVFSPSTHYSLGHCCIDMDSSVLTLERP